MIEAPQIIQVLAIFIVTLLQTVFVWLFRMYTWTNIHLDACEQKSLGNHAYLSSWCLRYGLDDMIFAPFCLSAWVIYLKIWKTLCEAPVWYAKVLPKPYDDTSWKPYTHMLLVFALSFVKLLWPLREFFSCFHDQDSRAHHIPVGVSYARLEWIFCKCTE